MISNTARISAGLLAAALFYTASPPDATAQAKAPDVLFVQTAKNVAFKDGVLTLQDVSPATIFFSERPQRIVGHVRTICF
jgi:hypothetical protein